MSISQGIMNGFQIGMTLRDREHQREREAEDDRRYNNEQDFRKSQADENTRQFNEGLAQRKHEFAVNDGNQKTQLGISKYNAQTARANTNLDIRQYSDKRADQASAAAMDNYIIALETGNPQAIADAVNDVLQDDDANEKLGKSLANDPKFFRGKTKGDKFVAVVHPESGDMVFATKDGYMTNERKAGNNGTPTRINVENVSGLMVKELLKNPAAMKRWNEYMASKGLDASNMTYEQQAQALAQRQPPAAAAATAPTNPQAPTGLAAVAADTRRLFSAASAGDLANQAGAPVARADVDVVQGAAEQRAALTAQVVQLRQRAKNSNDPGLHNKLAEAEAALAAVATPSAAAGRINEQVPTAAPRAAAPVAASLQQGNPLAAPSRGANTEAFLRRTAGQEPSLADIETSRVTEGRINSFDVMRELNDQQAAMNSKRSKLLEEMNMGVKDYNSFQKGMLDMGESAFKAGGKDNEFSAQDTRAAVNAMFTLSNGGIARNGQLAGYAMDNYARLAPEVRSDPVVAAGIAMARSNPSVNPSLREAVNEIGALIAERRKQYKVTDQQAAEIAAMSMEDIASKNGVAGDIAQTLHNAFTAAEKNNGGR